MATAYYPPPPANNYFQTGPSPHHAKQRGYRVCDQCGTVETSAGKFRLCGGCMVTQYCSPTCQKLHWPAHKPICKHTAAQMSSAKQLGAASVYGDENLAKHLRKFTSAHATLLGWAGFQALRLKRVPANVRQQALLVELDHCDNPDSLRRFTVKGTHMVARTYITERDPAVAEDIRRREERSRQSGGIGCAVILVQCGPISQVMPVEVDSPGKIAWDTRDDWADVLAHCVRSGRTDFTPTSKGILYG